ncbi:NFX1-type zinc finger-containing protein 1-like isoform X1 [Chiloscyllium plagiosum]|uniref:NFX1-type zinc finger-containing protein 1-like isoform X1 n=1 Tax=Chiloscyllium plagiosum TaxID=36176 RepID=UPI001CB872C0|nr:NFX1-type zinc finger-containing protein 1-like isoform X1 [Chiloscyllium plagiosum]XP_043575227.1 NFX1-type zinc finger-containing protein 1-like isoform X1 [Chiloscyllium plagiosum]
MYKRFEDRQKLSTQVNLTDDENQQSGDQSRRWNTSSSKWLNRQHSKDRRQGNSQVFNPDESHFSSTQQSSGRPETSGGTQRGRQPRKFGSRSHPASGQKETPEAGAQGKPRGQRDGHPHKGRPPNQTQNTSENASAKSGFERRNQSEPRWRKPKFSGSQSDLLDCSVEGSAAHKPQRQQKPQEWRDGQRRKHPQHVQNRSESVVEKSRFEQRDPSEHRRRNPRFYGSQPNLLDSFRENMMENDNQRQQKSRGRSLHSRGMGRANQPTTHEGHSQQNYKQPRQQNLAQCTFMSDHRPNQQSQSTGPSAAKSSKPAEHRQWSIDSRELQRLAGMEPANVIMRLASPRSGLKDFLNQANPDKNLILSFLKVLNSTFKCQSNRSNLHYLLQLIKDSMFLKSILPGFVVSVQTETLPEALLENSAHLDPIVNLLHELITVYPMSAFLEVSLLVTLVQMTSKYLQSIGFPASTETRINLGNLQAMIAELQEKKRLGNLKSDTYTYFKGPEVENFRCISVYPTYEDIHLLNKPYVRPNIVTGKYPDTATYLDIHFRLLREDFVRPLRDGISKLLSCDQKELQKDKIDDIRIYFDAHILGPLCTRSGVFFQVKFNIKPLKFIRWESSKRLLFGSFLCLSKDKFATMLCATVADRNLKGLKEGIITLHFTKDCRDQLADVNSRDSFLMVETTAYFEAYRHVLEGLKEIKDNKLPFQKYIVEGQAHIAQPKYLTSGRQDYTLQSLMTNQRLPGPKQSNMPKFAANQLNLSNNFDVCDFAKWPSKEKLKFDESQMQAMQLALTKEVAMIQGPPGTGKTYLGLKVAKVLLANEQIWQSGAGSPILVVCYTNHALDQFLEGILKFMDTGLVRIGGRSSSGILSAFSMHKLRKEFNFRKDLPRYLKEAQTELINERELIQRQIEVLAASLDASEKGVLQLYTLSKYISTKHMYYLQVGMVPSEDDSIDHCTILEWLGISPTSGGYFTFGSTTPEEKTERDLIEMGSDVMEAETGSQSDLLDWEEDEAELNQLASEGGPSTQSHEVERSDLTSVSKHYWRSEEDAEETDSDATEWDTGTSSDLAEEEETLQDDDELIQVTEEAEHLEADRMIGDEDIQKQVKHATARVAKIRDSLLAFKPESLSRSQADSHGDGKWEQTKKTKKKIQKMLKEQLKLQDYMPEDEADRINNVWELALLDRWRLYRLWLSKYQIETRCKILESEQLYQRIVDRLLELRNQEEVTILRKAKVVGMTTTGAAKYRTVLQELQPKIVIVEEAAEVLEAHIITTLSSACEHLILIGDHQQLRPSATVYELAKDFNLDVSLFERLISMKTEFVRLDYQHRMRPEIAGLITPHIYEKLENSASVNLYERIKGVSTNLYFINHQELENINTEGKSYHNPHEANFVKSLCEYFIQQEYQPSQITILTTYSGQLLYLRKLMPKKRFDGVRVCVVDKYQGEENDIVILSLVRSNLKGVVGFLRIPNRICVALSRAKKGFYCIGNMSMLSNRVPLWSNIVDYLYRNDKIGPALRLSCQNHPETYTLVSKSEEFKQVPEGGCTKACDFRLSCGHACGSLCHPFDQEHKKYKCLKPCQQCCKEGHQCRDICSNPCGKCNVKVTKVVPHCGHEQQMPCFCPPEVFVCQEPCTKAIECGHSCMRRCGETCTKKCPVKVSVTLSCGHKNKVMCHLWMEAEAGGEPLLCQTLCGGQLACGHSCRAVCSECAGGRLHIPCSAPCQRMLVCSHVCQKPCTLTDCPPCGRPCENRCPHGKCPNKCGEMCVPCTKPCQWACPHSRCTRLCHEPCDREPCNRPCLQVLKCKHPCIGLCGEPCPSKCRVCHEAEVTEIFFGNEDDPKSRFVQLKDCQHVFALPGFDDLMRQSEHNKSTPRLFNCPKCSTPIRWNMHCGNVIKSTLAKIEEAKAKILGDKEDLNSWKNSLEKCLEMKVELSNCYPTEFENLQFQLQEPNTNSWKLAVLGNQISLLSKVARLKSKANMLLEEQRMKIEKEAELQADWILRSRVQFTAQEISNINREISKLTHLSDIYLIQNSMQEQGREFDHATQLTVDDLLQVLEGRKAKYDEGWLQESVNTLKNISSQDKNCFIT